MSEPSTKERTAERLKRLEDWFARHQADRDEQQQTLASLKQLMNEDRLSDRECFPDDSGA